ncbi:MAG: hypothetical protein RIC07_24230 [Coleofasciculus sp. E1-EBD-02]
MARLYIHPQLPQLPRLPHLPQLPSAPLNPKCFSKSKRLAAYV